MAKTSSASDRDLTRDLEALRTKLAETENKLAEAQEVIRAIQSGDVDAVVVSGPRGEQVFTLKGAEYAYRALVEAMNEGAATLSADGAVLYCNRRLSDLVGIPLEQIIGSPAVRLVAEEARHAFETLFARALSGDAAQTELELLTSGGGAIPAYVSLREMKAYEPVALCMVVADLSEKKKRDELIAAGRLANSILDSAAEAIAVCDETGTIIKVNEAMERLCGLNPLFQPFDRALPLRIKPQSGAPGQLFSISSALAGAAQRALEVSFRREDGRTFSLLLSSGRIAGSSAVVGCVLTLTDITQRMLVEQALIQAEKLASVGRMASTIAHEINNPLETIGHAIYLAITDPRVSPESKSYLDMAVQELERVNHITRQTLAFHRESQTATAIDLRESLDGVLRLFSGRLRSRGIAVEKRYSQAARVQAVDSEIRQIISNLLSNSMDALSNKGRIHIRVAPALRKNGAASVRLTIADTGQGIPRERLKKIFEPFFTTKEVVGTGLGLWVTQQIAEKHGAAIRVRSRPAKGTVFWLIFPGAEDSSPAPQTGR